MQNWGNCVVIYCCVISRLELYGPLIFKGLNAFQGQGCMHVYQLFSACAKTPPLDTVQLSHLYA